MIFCVEDDSNIRELVVYTLESTGLKAGDLRREVPFWKRWRWKRRILSCSTSCFREKTAWNC